jgi:hypothetical protein
MTIPGGTLARKRDQQDGATAPQKRGATARSAKKPLGDITNIVVAGSADDSLTSTSTGKSKSGKVGTNASDKYKVQDEEDDCEEDVRTPVVKDMNAESSPVVLGVRTARRTRRNSFGFGAQRVSAPGRFRSTPYSRPVSTPRNMIRDAIGRGGGIKVPAAEALVDEEMGIGEEKPGSDVVKTSGTNGDSPKSVCSTATTVSAGSTNSSTKTGNPVSSCSSTTSTTSNQSSGRASADEFDWGATIEILDSPEAPK